MDAFILTYAGKDVFAQGSCDGNLFGIVAYNATQFCDQGIGLRDMCKAGAVAVKIIVHHGGIGLLTLGDMRQQATTAEEVNKSRISREPAEQLYILVGKIALLALKRKRC